MTESRRQQMRSRVRSVLAASLLALLGGSVALRAADHVGHVTVAGVPVPGATITATQGDRRAITTSNDEGLFRFAGLDEGTWTVRVEMPGFGRSRARSSCSLMPW